MGPYFWNGLQVRRPFGGGQSNIERNLEMAPQFELRKCFPNYTKSQRRSKEKLKKDMLVAKGDYISIIRTGVKL